MADWLAAATAAQSCGYRVAISSGDAEHEQVGEVAPKSKWRYWQQLERAGVLDSCDGHQVRVGHQDGAPGQDDEVAVVLGLHVDPGVGWQVMGGDVGHGPIDSLHVPTQALAEDLLGLADRSKAVELLLRPGGKF